MFTNIIGTLSVSFSFNLVYFFLYLHKEISKILSIKTGFKNFLFSVFTKHKLKPKLNKIKYEKI